MMTCNALNSSQEHSLLGLNIIENTIVPLAIIAIVANALLVLVVLKARYVGKGPLDS